MSGYIGVDNLSKKINSLYIGINGLSKKVNKAYIGVDGISKLWYEGIDTTDPNTRYESKDLGTWSSTSDVDTFCSNYNHDNNYTGLSLGNYVTIMDGTFNVDWEIAGFDMEYNRTASDNKTYNNGYGICWIPKIHATSRLWTAWSDDDEMYYKSDIHGYINNNYTGMYSKLKLICGSHIIKRNMLLCNGYSSSGTLKYSNSYTWTTSYLTLMSGAQLTGNLASYYNKYDDGEANYKLPLFNYENYYTAYSYWTRGNGGVPNDTRFGINVYRTNANSSSINVATSKTSLGIRPMMYIR